MFRQAQCIRRDHAEARDLRDGQVDEDDAAIQHLHAQGHVAGEHQQAREQRGPEDRNVDGAPVHLAFAAASRRATVSSNSPKRSFAASSPPTVNGSFTAGTPALVDSHSEARGLW